MNPIPPPVAVAIAKGCGRRGFLGVLLGLCAGTPLLAKVADTVNTATASAARPPERRWTVLNKVSVAGFQYHQGPSLLAAGLLAPGEPVNLVAEPENAYDPFAVRLEVAGKKIGYVPRAENHHLSRLLRGEARLAARTLEVSEGGPPWRQVRVEISLEHG